MVSPIVRADKPRTAPHLPGCVNRRQASEGHTENRFYKCARRRFTCFCDRRSPRTSAVRYELTFPSRPSASSGVRVREKDRRRPFQSACRVDRCLGAMGPIATLLERLRERDIRIVFNQGRLNVNAPKGVLDHDLRVTIVERRAEIIAALESAGIAAQQRGTTTFAGPTTAAGVLRG
jgi:hypothetical protein